MDLLDEAQQVALAVGKTSEGRQGEMTSPRSRTNLNEFKDEPQRDWTHSSGQEVNWRWTMVRFRLWSRYCRLIMRSTCVGVVFCVVRLSVIGP